MSVNNGPARRIIVKIGSGVVTSGGPDSLTIDRNTIFRLAAELSQIVERGGVELVVVSSGAVALGIEELDLSAKPERLAEIQAMAAVGQGLLMQLWREAFGRHRLRVAQVLLTHDDLRDRTRLMNVRATLDALLSYGVVPIVNENDTVATDEITVGDNDTLGCQVAKLVGGDLLMLLTTVAGLLDSQGEVVPLVRPSDDPFAHVNGAGSEMGRGGMASKLEAAAAAAHGGIEVVIANGRLPTATRQALEGASVGTRFEPEPDGGLPSRKHWIAYTLKPRGAVRLDAGAATAVLQNGASVLPVGIVAVEGGFVRGDAVRVLDADGVEIARGLSRIDAETLREGGLGQRGPLVVHRDDLVRR